MSPYLIVIGVVVALAALGIGFFWGKAVTEKQVRIETVQGPVRTVSVPGATIKCTSSKRSSPSTPSSGTASSATSSGSGDNTETVLTLEVPEALGTSTASAAAPMSKQLPDWHVSALGGYDFSGAKWSFGGGIERHIAGPFYGGAFGLSSGVVGVSLSANF